MRNAPNQNSTIIISELSEPKLTLDVTSIHGYDPDHNAWYISARFPQGNNSYKLWVAQKSDKIWRIYDISTPLAIKQNEFIPGQDIRSTPFVRDHEHP